MTTGSDETSVAPSPFVAAGDSVAQCLERGALPARPPIATLGLSPADDAASTLALAAGTRITTAAGELAPRGPKMREASAAAAQGLTTQDVKNGEQIQAVGNSVTDKLLGKMAGAPESAGGGSTSSASSGKFLGLDKTDWILGGSQGVSGALFEDVAKRTRKAIEAVPGTGAGKADPGMKKLVEEIKTPFKVLGKQIPLGTRMGGLAGLAMTIPTIAKEVGEDHISAAEAITREGAGLAAGTAIGGFVGTLIPVPVVGTAIGMAVGGYAGAKVSELVGVAWDPAANAVGKVVHGIGSLFSFGASAAGGASW